MPYNHRFRLWPVNHRPRYFVAYQIVDSEIGIVRLLDYMGDGVDAVEGNSKEQQDPASSGHKRR